MGGFRRLAAAEGPGDIAYWWRDTDDGAEILGVQDVAPQLELNKAMAAENDGWSPSGELRRVASIPAVVIEDWLRREGIDVFDPRQADRVARKLNCSDWRHLRTAPGRVKALPDGGFR